VRARWIERWDGPLERGERPEPRAGAREVKIAVEACGIGLTVLNCIRGDLGDDPDDLPRVPGHELVGRIVETGIGVDSDRVGERVAGYFYLFCGGCERCLAGDESLCLDLRGFIGVDVDGGYAERVSLPAGNAVPLRDEIDPVAATAIPDAIATPVHVARRASVGPGDRVAVIAAGGGVGIHMSQVARAYGATVVGLEIDGAKHAYLRDELGLDVIDSSDFARAELPRSWRGEADVVVDLLGSESSLEWAQAALAPRGRMVVLTTFRGVGFRASPRTLVFKQGSILGSRYASRHEVLEAARLVHAGAVRPIVSEQVGPDDVDGVHDALRRGEVLGRGVLSWG